MNDNSFKLPRLKVGDNTKFIEWIFEEITEAELLAIASADYGLDVSLHFAGLKDIVAHRELSDLTQWHPGEVIELQRWASVPEGASASLSLSIHHQRLFCCAILFMIDGTSPGYVVGLEATLLQMIESLVPFPQEISRFAADMILWRLHSSNDCQIGELACMGLGLLHLALVDRTWSNEDLLQLIEWLDHLDKKEIAELREAEYGAHTFSKNWLLQHEEWIRCDTRWLQLGANLQRRLDRRHNKEVRAWIELISAMQSN